MASFVNPDATFDAQADRVLNFFHKVVDLRDKLNGSEADTRRVSLNNIAMAANASVATLRLFGWAKAQGDGMLIQALRLGQPEFVNMVAEDLLRSSKLFLLLETQFQTEAAFRNVLSALGQPTGKQGFFNVAKEILDATGVTPVDAKLRTLNVPALMRNSMHANGIHHGWKGADTIEMIDGVEFRFEHDRRVQCGSWFHIITALSASMNVVEEVLVSRRVASIALIPDEYALQKAAESGASMSSGKP